MKKIGKMVSRRSRCFVRRTYKHWSRAHARYNPLSFSPCRCMRLSPRSVHRFSHSDELASYRLRVYVLLKIHLCQKGRKGATESVGAWPKKGNERATHGEWVTETGSEHTKESVLGGVNEERERERNFNREERKLIRATCIHHGSRFIVHLCQSTILKLKLFCIPSLYLYVVDILKYLFAVLSILRCFT